MRTVIIVTMIRVAATVAVASEAMKAIELASPAGSQSLTPSLSSSGDGLFLTWLEREGNAHSLRFARYDGRSFSESLVVHASDRFFANWADFASMLPLADGRLVVHWLEKTAAGPYDYDIRLSISANEGRSWSKPVTLNRDAALGEHGFVSLSRKGRNGLAAVWLDGRQYRDGAHDNEMALMFTTLEGDALGEEVLLDGRVCECCQTAMAATEDGYIVAYRDRSPDEIRDISVLRYAQGGWSEPRTLNRDGWHITGCPVNGPQVAADGNRVAVAWFTAAGGDPRVQLVFSADAGRSFSEPIRIDAGQPIGRVDVEWLGDGAVTSWVESTGEIRVRSVSHDGAAGEAIVVATTGSQRSSGFPRMASFRDGIYITWTEAHSREGPSQVRVAKLQRDRPETVELLDEPVPVFEAADLEGGTVRLSELEGKVVVVNFWGIWCKSCREEIPHLVELQRKWRGDGLVVLGADYGDAPDDIRAFVRELGMNYPVLIDDGLADKFGVLVYPTSLVIDRRGRLRFRVEGYRPESFEKLAEVVQLLLATS